MCCIPRLGARERYGRRLDHSAATAQRVLLGRGATPPLVVPEAAQTSGLDANTIATLHA
jgi:hypothetical protein